MNVIHLSVARWRKALFYHTGLSSWMRYIMPSWDFSDNDISDILKLDGSHVQSQINSILVCLGEN